MLVQEVSISDTGVSNFEDVTLQMANDSLSNYIWNQNLTEADDTWSKEKTTFCNVKQNKKQDVTREPNRERRMVVRGVINVYVKKRLLSLPIDFHLPPNQIKK